MKLRLRGNSVRLRLGQSEVRRLSEGEALTETLTFGPGAASFAYTLRPSGDFQPPAITFTGGELVVSLSARDIDAWAAGDAVGIRATQAAGKKHEMALLIEKDFECLDNENGESQEDAFPSPKRCGE
ncbi:MAG: DUF7009 family protein [Tepidisphaeraceae bacterium]